jgi:hypothetical protein
MPNASYRDRGLFARVVTYVPIGKRTGVLDRVVAERVRRHLVEIGTPDWMGIDWNSDHPNAGHVIR